MNLILNIVFLLLIYFTLLVISDSDSYSLQPVQYNNLSLENRPFQNQAELNHHDVQNKNLSPPSASSSLQNDHLNASPMLSIIKSNR